MDPVYRFSFQVSAAMLDGNRHVNNVVYVQWMQEAALRHSEAVGCTRATLALGATWVARSHHIEYLHPALEGDTVTVLTWIATLRKVRSLRRYKFIRPADQAVLAQGETDWVLLDVKSGRPRLIPEEIRTAFTVLPQDREPWLSD